MKETYEDIQKLLEQFLSRQEAGQMTDDIRQADRLLSSVPAARVSQETVAAIQEKVHRRLAARHARRLHQRYFTAVAALVLVALLGFVFFVLEPVKPASKLPSLTISMNWDDDLGLDKDLNTKLENVSTQMEKLNQTAIQWLDENSNLAVEVENLEQIASSTDFWKG